MRAIGGGNRRLARHVRAANVRVGRDEGVDELHGRDRFLALVGLEPAQVGSIESAADERRERSTERDKQQKPAAGLGPEERSDNGRRSHERVLIGKLPRVLPIGKPGLPVTP